MKQTKRLKNALQKCTPRQRIIVGELAKGSTGKQALLKAGYSESVARTGQGDVLSKPQLRDALDAALEAEGISPAKIARSLRKGMTAKRTIVSKDGTVVGTEPDHNTRHKFIETILRVRDLNPPKQEVTTVKTYEERILEIRNNALP